MDESGVHVNSGVRLYGSSERGTRAVDISRHNVGENYTLFYLGGLLDKCYYKVNSGPSTAYDFIQFIHESCEARNERGERVLGPGSVLIADNCPIHCGFAERVLTPYLAERGVTFLKLPTFSPDLNPIELFFSFCKKKLASEYYQKLLEYSVPIAVMEACEGIGHEKMYNFFKGVTGNYMNL